MPHLPGFLKSSPPSMLAGNHEMREYYSNQDSTRSSPYTTQSITPYLGLRARLSQVWINRWTILLMLVLARTLIALTGINSDLASAHREALSACTTVESLGSAMASMPHYMSQGVNEITATGVEKAVNGLFEMTTMSVTGVEEIVIFVINLMTSTYLCLITLAVSGSLHAVIDVLDDANAQLKTAVSGLGDDMANVVSGFDAKLQAFANSIQGVSVFGKSISLPDPLNMDDEINQLRNMTLPNGLSKNLQTLNNSIPTFTQVQNFTNNAIRIPFELLKTQINGSLGNYQFDRSIFPVPQKEQLSFCGKDDGINDFFQDLFDLALLAKKVFLIVLIIGAILACIPMAYREVRRWRTQQERARLVGASQHDSMDVVYIVSRPYTSTFGIKVSSKCQSIRRQTLIRWVIAYATTDAALFVLALGVAGLFSCLCQYILLKALEKEVPNLTEQVGSFAEKVINQLAYSSANWSQDTNNVIMQKNTAINDEMFGWVNTSVSAINDTLNTFVRETTNVLNTTFGGTVLYDPITEVFNCLVGLKVVGLQKALTWVEDHAHVNFPLMPNNTFTIGAIASIAGDQAADSSFLANPGDAASDKITSTVARFLDKLYTTIQTEVFISLFVCLIWIIIVLIAITRALFLWFGRDKTRGEGGAPPLNMPPSPSAITAPANTQMAMKDFRSDHQDRYRNFSEVPLNDEPTQQRSYSPAPNYTREDPFSDKAAIGHGGMRTDQQTGRAMNQIRSVHGSIWQADSKM